MDISNVILSSNYGLPHPLNAQTIFDKCALHLIHQGRRSYDPGKGCAYRGPDGSACAVGALIADERYDVDMEGRTAWHLVRNQMKDLAPFDRLLEDLQALHDGMQGADGTQDGKVDVAKLTHGLRNIAKDHNLSAAILAAPVVAAPPAELTSLLRNTVEA